MEYRIERAYGKKLNDYKDVLDKYNATYFEDGRRIYAIIELKSVEELLALPKLLDQDVIISEYRDALIIYDDYME